MAEQQHYPTLDEVVGSPEAAVSWLRRASSAIYLATDGPVADDISPRLRACADHIAALCASPPPSPAGEGWQTIDSAPREGCFWGYEPEDGEEGVAFFDGEEFIFERTERELNEKGFSQGYRPTLWHPLPSPPGSEPSSALAEADLKDKAEAVVFHYFNCNDGDGDGCGRLRPTMAELARAIGYDDPSVNDEIAEALAHSKGE